ncbi:MAG: response regulator transcription factor [Flavobacteriales bacterium]|nr:response regulator transcription factor [Flavobacteriales bacterium]
MSYAIKLILVDDEELFRSGIAFMIQREPNMEILFQASNGSELLDYLNENTNHPDIIMMDLKMPTLNGVETTKIIQRKYPNINVIAMSSYGSKAFIANMIHQGASSYIIKNSSPKEMIDTINRVATRGFYYNNTALTIIREEENADIKTKSVLDTDFLSNRERDVLKLICKQQSSAEIAKSLFISPRTVEVHRTKLLTKTGVKNVAGLVIFAIQNNLVPIEDLLNL